MSTIVIIGFGYIGQRLAAREHARGNTVHALVRSEPAASTGRQAHVAVLRGDLDKSFTAASLPTQNAIVYYLAPPPPEGEHDTRMQRFLTALNHANAPQAIVYISTTGVYGNCHGQWITEDTPTRPTQTRGKRRLDAEQQLHTWNKQSPATRCVVLRVAGIYGPDRLPLERLKRGEPMVNDPHSPSYINVIHADDLVKICMAAADRGETGQIFNVADGRPLSMFDYFRRIARHANLPPPPTLSMAEAEHQLSPGMLSYLKESRRIDDRKLLTDLGVKLGYDDLDQGIVASLAAPL